MSTYQFCWTILNVTHGEVSALCTEAFEQDSLAQLAVSICQG